MFVPVYFPTDRAMYKYEYKNNINYSFGEFELKGYFEEDYTYYWIERFFVMTDENLGNNFYMSGNHKIICAVGNYTEEYDSFCYYPICKFDTDKLYYFLLDIDLNDEYSIEKVNSINICSCKKDNEILFTKPYTINIDDFTIEESLSTEIYFAYETTGFYIISEIPDTDYFVHYEIDGSEPYLWPLIIF